MRKQERHAAILALVREHRIQSQEQLRELLSGRDLDVTQATLSRDIRELRLVKVHDAEGGTHYTLPPEAWDLTPPIRRLLGTLFVSAEEAGNLLVVKTLTGGAQPVGTAIDWEEWPEVAGTIAGDDTILVILRDNEQATAIRRRIEELAGLEEAEA